MPQDRRPRHAADRRQHLFSITANFILLLFPHGFTGAFAAPCGFFDAYLFSLILATSFVTLNGLFFYLMHTPTAPGCPVMDQFEGFKLYMKTAEKDRLNLQAQEITAERFEAMLL